MRILFQGDSITDGNRGRNDDKNHILGHSYAYIASCVLGSKNPKAGFDFVNRAVSGDTVSCLYARAQRDIIDLKPDVLSILIGVNDANERFNTKGFYSNIFEETYGKLLTRCREANPSLRFIILEPFTLDSGNFCSDDYNRFRSYVSENAQASKRIADEFNAVFVPLFSVFENALSKAPADYWCWDSVHPTYNGHGIIADAFLKYTAEIFKTDNGVF